MQVSKTLCNFTCQKSGGLRRQKIQSIREGIRKRTQIFVPEKRGYVQ